MDAVVLVTSVMGFAALTYSMTAADLAASTRTLHFHITDAVLRHDGIPIKYAGDTLLALFTGG